MHPILFKLGPITIYSYGFFVAAAFLLAMAIAMLEAKKKHLEYKIVPDLGFYLILSAIAGSRFLYVILNPEQFVQAPLEAFQFWKGGLVFLGGALAAVGTGALFLRKKEQPFWSWADAFAPGIAAGQAIGRIGCLMAGCCYGRPCDLPWAITFSNPNSLAPLLTPLHPTQIYHSLAGVVTFIILIVFKRYLRKSGQLFSLLLFCYAFFRFVIENFRGDYRGNLGPLSLTQVLAIGLAILGLFIFIYRRRI